MSRKNKVSLKQHLPHLLTIFLGVATAFLTTKFIVSAHGGDTNLIHGCVKPGTGLLRIIGANDNCEQNETPLDWTQQGSTGSTETPISAGGGLTGAWEGSYVIPNEGGCNPSTTPFKAVIVEDSANNLSGSVNGLTGDGQSDPASLIGTSVEPAVLFETQFNSFQFEGTITDINHMSGTIPNITACAATWSAQRTPLITP